MELDYQKPLPWP